MLVVVVALVTLERLAWRGQRRHDGPAHRRACARLAAARRTWRLARPRAVSSASSSPPSIRLPGLASSSTLAGFSPRLVGEALNTVGISALATSSSSSSASSSPMPRGSRMAALAARCCGREPGYALPGTVVAIGLPAPLAGLVATSSTGDAARLGISTGLLLSGAGRAPMPTVRFLAVSAGGVDAGFARSRGASTTAPARLARR
jgi:iron(III) transport system permease protein